MIMATLMTLGTLTPTITLAQEQNQTKLEQTLATSNNSKVEFVDSKTEVGYYPDEGVIVFDLKYDINVISNIICVKGHKTIAGTERVKASVSADYKDFQHALSKKLGIVSIYTEGIISYMTDKKGNKVDWEMGINPLLKYIGGNNTDENNLKKKLCI